MHRAEMSSAPTLQDLGSLVPRRYQEEVFRRARQDNIIAALDTGSGKTFISLLLIKWIAAQKEHKGKAIIFLVPRVALVQQQGDYIAKYTSLRVIKMFGALDLDLSDRKAWKQRFRDYDVFVMTAQIFLNIVTHSLWSIDKVSLMVFDECHHARKNHPYNGILRECLLVHPTSRPKIFGMTASPIWDPKDPTRSLELLETNMDCKVVGVIENYSELQEHAPRPVEIVKTYASPPGDSDFPFPSIYTCIKVFESDIRETSDFSWSNTEGRYHSTLYNLGPYSASLFLYTECLQVTTRLEHGNPIAHHFLPTKVPLESRHSLNPIREVLDDFDSFFPKDPQTEIPIPVPQSWCTPKVKALVDILLSHYSVSFQAIVFVEQRQVAACLARILPVIPELTGKIRSGHFVGEGVNSEGLSSSMGINTSDSLGAFRDGTINTLVTTAVSEEGLDFPACDLVVRFDSLQHMVGYIQSRGRARNKTSTFIIMVQENDVAQLARYKALREGEPQVARVYLSRNDDMELDDDSDEEELTSVDVVERERYVVPDTAAILNYDNAIGLLDRLCALIPRDAFTPTHKPTYSGDFTVTLRLPSSLPLPPENLVYHGPMRRSKKEAKRAVAFLAARRLHELDVFNEYLLPVPSLDLDELGDADAGDNAPYSEYKVPESMEVMVRDPWVMGPRLWIHEVVIDGWRVAGLVTGTRFPLDNMRRQSVSVELRPGCPVRFSDEESHQRRAMEEYTKLGMCYRLTGRPIRNGLSVFLVPLTDERQPDFEAIDQLLNRRGSSDWSSVGEDEYSKFLVTVSFYTGRVYRLRRIRHDITPLSCPTPGSREADCSSYAEYYTQRFKSAPKPPFVPTDGPMVELELLPRMLCGLYDLKHNGRDVAHTVRDGGLFPLHCCRWIRFCPDICRAFELLPAVCHRLTDMYRNTCLRSQIGLPSIKDDLLVEALTLQGARAGYNNQRLETLGDAVLQLCTTVHLFNVYPHRHEGQLSSLRRMVVSNRFLSACALAFGLEGFLTNENFPKGQWRYTWSEHSDGWISTPERCVRRKIPRRGLQDSMEAILGASFLSGGISTALKAGRALGLSLGGAEICYMQSTLPTDPESSESSSSSYFVKLEASLGYKFSENQILLEAVTHPSFSGESGGKSYQRLEFLGDAVFSLAIMEHLYDRFEEATSYQLSLIRSKLVCNVALAWVAVKRLQLHKIILANSVSLNMAIDQYVPVLEAASAGDIIKTGWRYDPPKALSDVLESLIGAVYVDSAYNYEKTGAALLLVMEDLLDVIDLGVGEDPVSRLVKWTAGQGCQKVVIKEIPKVRGERSLKGTIVMAHDKVVAGPILASSRRVARFEASDIALEYLIDDASGKSLEKICTCRRDLELDREEAAEEGAVVRMLVNDYD